ncbi:translation initiation factor IF-2-like [Moschus berezovskii]|uniref:translation initiation factor IF-2-like n=1 Tax=Moschus berezovskii TaxID=68408 RepID=UPI002444E93F|nr:translation initiation factor IF-2-like [Moschus berezovskii]
MTRAGEGRGRAHPGHAPSSADSRYKNNLNVPLRKKTGPALPRPATERRVQPRENVTSARGVTSARLPGPPASGGHRGAGRGAARRGAGRAGGEPRARHPGARPEAAAAAAASARLSSKLGPAGAGGRQGRCPARGVRAGSLAVLGWTRGCGRGPAGECRASAPGAGTPLSSVGGALPLARAPPAQSVKRSEPKQKQTPAGIPMRSWILPATSGDQMLCVARSELPN